MLIFPHQLKLLGVIGLCKVASSCTPSGVQILVILVFDQECRNISRSRVLKRRAVISPFSPESRSMQNGKKNMGRATNAIKTHVTLLENCVGNQFGH
jgi:hypothetical protein